MSEDEIIFINNLEDENLSYTHSVEVKDYENKPKSKRKSIYSDNYTPDSESDSDYEWNSFKKNSKIKKKKAINNRTYHCQYCTFESKKKSVVDHHSKRHAVDKPLTCKMCNKEYHLVSLTNYQYSPDDFVCKRCIYPSEENTTKQDSNGENSKKRFNCNECDFTAMDLTRLRYHIRRHTGERPFKCPVCPYASIDHPNLKKHLKLHERDAIHKCEQCGESFAEAVELEEHVCKISDDKIEDDYYFCEICPFKCVALA